MGYSVDGEDISIDIDDVGQPTAKAHKVIIDSTVYWLPKSMCRVYEKKKKAFGPEWLFAQKGLI